MDATFYQFGQLLFGAFDGVLCYVICENGQLNHISPRFCLISFDKCAFKKIIAFLFILCWQFYIIFNKNIPDNEHDIFALSKSWQKLKILFKSIIAENDVIAFAIVVSCEIIFEETILKEFVLHRFIVKNIIYYLQKERIMFLFCVEERIMLLFCVEESDHNKFKQNQYLLLHYSFRLYFFHEIFKRTARIGQNCQIIKTVFAISEVRDRLMQFSYEFLRVLHFLLKNIDQRLRSYILCDLILICIVINEDHKG